MSAADIHIDHKALLRLMQLSSATLPVGAYAFSQGLESAIEYKYIDDQASCYEWLRFHLRYGMGQTDLPMLLRMLHYHQSCDAQGLLQANAELIAMRETKELQLADSATGMALAKLLIALGLEITPFSLSQVSPVSTRASMGQAEPSPDKVATLTRTPNNHLVQISFVSMFAAAASAWQIDSHSACYGLLWSWLENQVAAATKLVPLGQVSAQQLLSQLIPELSQIVAYALSVSPTQIGTSLPGLALLSCRHEHQYSRLFRS